MTEKLRNGPKRRDQSTGPSSCVWPPLQVDSLIFSLAWVWCILGIPAPTLELDMEEV